MATLRNVIRYEYVQAATKIRDLKAQAYRATVHEKYAYRSPDLKTFRNSRPPEHLMSAGWTYGKIKFERIESHMSPRHERWKQYSETKRRATLLLAARMILKASEETVLEKSEIGSLLSMGIFRSQAGTARRQKSLAYSAHRLLRKVGNRLQKQPERFSRVDEWLAERLKSEVNHV